MAWLPCTYRQIRGVFNTAHHTHRYLESVAAVYLWEVLIIVPLSWQQYRWMRATYPCGASDKTAMIKTILLLCCLNHITLCNGLSFFGWIDIRGHIFSANVQWHEPQSVKCGIVSLKQVRKKNKWVIWHLRHYCNDWPQAAFICGMKHHMDGTLAKTSAKT